MLIIEIESTFNIKFNPTELSKMENIGQMIELIEQVLLNNV